MSSVMGNFGGEFADDARRKVVEVGERLRERGHDAYDMIARAAGRTTPDMWERIADAARDAARSARGPSNLRLIAAVGVGFLAGVALLSSRKVAMQATSAITGDWFAQLKLEHRQVEALFEAVSATSDDEPAKRMAILAKLSYALNRHALQEENVIYPALRDVDQGASSKALAAEHFDMKTYLHELHELPADDPRWLSKMKAFRKLVRSHVRDEEDHIFPALHSRMSAADNAKLTKAMNREGVKLA